MSSWVIIIIAGLLETFWAVFLKLSHGFTRPIASVLTIFGMIASFYFLSLALKHLPLSTAYAVWTGIGIVGTFIFGVIYFHESVNVPQVISSLLIFIGIIGLRIFTHTS